ncbi:MAG: hypothetical protein V2A62_04570 [Candidatus Woesearchaeota archaeon]
MRITYKQRCSRCKKNFVLVTWKNKYPLCYECQRGELVGEVKDPTIKKLFDIPEEFYKENSFLRSVKINYLKFGQLSEKQLEFFKKTVTKMKEERECSKAVKVPEEVHFDGISLRALRNAKREEKEKKKNENKKKTGVK